MNNETMKAEKIILIKQPDYKRRIYFPQMAIDGREKKVRHKHQVIRGNPIVTNIKVKPLY